MCTCKIPIANFVTLMVIVYVPPPVQRNGLESVHLLSVLVFAVAALALLGVHSLDSAWGSATIWRLEAKVDVLLRVEADDERWDVDELLAHANVTLADQDASVVDRLGKPKL